MNINEVIYNVGVNDYKIKLFENQYQVYDGMKYNSYLINDNQIAVLNSVEKNYVEEWISNIKQIIGKKEINYLIIQHMEPDHSGGILELLKEYPNIKIVASNQAFKMLNNFFNINLVNNQIIVKEKDTLTLGKSKLIFFEAKMIHWPEVMMIYEVENKVLFSADAFGKFGTNEDELEWEKEARRYYYGIIGKYGIQVQQILKKIRTLDIQYICSLHGPILKNNINYYLESYDKWSSNQSETKGVVINYCSIYGNTQKVVYELEKLLKKEGYEEVILNDLSECDIHKAISDAFQYPIMILASPTYNNNLFTYMKYFLNGIIERNYHSRIIGLIENGSWNPASNKIIKDILISQKNIIYLKNEITILSSMNEEIFLKLKDLVYEIINI